MKKSVVHFDVTTGSETIEWASAKVAMFVHERGEEEFLSKSSKVSRIGVQNFQPAVPGIDPALSGRWVSSGYEVEEGTLLKVYMTCKSEKFGSVAKTGVMILRVRGSGPFGQITIPLSGHRLTALKQVQIRGRFDVLSLEDAMHRYGYVLKEPSGGNYSPSSVNSVCKYAELAEGQKLRERVVGQTVQNSDGHKVTVVSVRKLRKLGV